MFGLITLDVLIIIVSTVVFNVLDRKKFHQAFNKTVKSLMASGYSKSQAVSYAQKIFNNEK